MKTKLFFSIAAIAACALLAPAPHARAEKTELLTNGGPSENFDGWTSLGSREFEYYTSSDGTWFRADDDDCRLVQTIVLADKGITPEDIAAEPIVTASVISQGGRHGTVLVRQFDANGKDLSTHIVVAVNRVQFRTTSYSIDFKLNPNARTLDYVLEVEDTTGIFTLKYQACSLAITTYELTFVSNGKTIGTAKSPEVSSVTPPAASREGGYRFLGYFTEETGGEQIFNANYEYVRGSDSAWPPSDQATLYAQWDEPRRFTFVSVGATVGSASGYAGDSSFDVPIPGRTDGFIFGGYYTEGGRKVFDENGALVPGAVSALSPDVTLHARWTPPASSCPALDCSTIVYRGQLARLAGGAATNDAAYVKRMHFRVYDGAEATVPLWKVDNLDVTVNADGSFVQAFGDEALAALIATGKVTHVGVAIGASPALATELKPRRTLRPVAAVNRALAADGAALDARVGNLVTENALVAGNATVSSLEVAGRVDASGAGGTVAVSPLVVGPAERTRLLRGAGVKVFADGKPTEFSNVTATLRGQSLGTAPSDGIALVCSKAGGDRQLRCPAVVQYCRKGESVRAPTSDPGGFKVYFFPFAGN